MFIFDKLFKPIQYLFIKHNEKKWFDFILPFIFALIISLIIHFLPKPISLIGTDGVISLVNGMLQILSGFYIASMAAVSTFQKQGMDKIMDGSPVILFGNALTRRQFLTYLFGYLAFMSIFMALLHNTVVPR